MTVETLERFSLVHHAIGGGGGGGVGRDLTKPLCQALFHFLPFLLACPWESRIDSCFWVFQIIKGSRNQG